MIKNGVKLKGLYSNIDKKSMEYKIYHSETEFVETGDCLKFNEVMAYNMPCRGPDNFM